MKLKGRKSLLRLNKHFLHKWNFFLVIFFVAIIVTSVQISVFAANKGESPNLSEGAQEDDYHGENATIEGDNSKIVACGGYVCYTTHNGEYSGLVWIYVPTNSDVSNYNDAGAFQNVAV